MYVFCLLKHRCQETIDPLDVGQWAFYVVPTSLVDHERSDQESLPLTFLEKLTDPVPYVDLSSAVLTAMG